MNIGRARTHYNSIYSHIYKYTSRRVNICFSFNFKSNFIYVCRLFKKLHNITRDKMISPEARDTLFAVIVINEWNCMEIVGFPW